MSEAVRERKEHRISSPEELHDYMHVTGPGLWVMLAVIIALLAALIILASTMKMENLMDVQMQVSAAGAAVRPPQLTCTLTDERKDQVKTGMKVRVAGQEGTVSALVEDEKEVQATVILDREDAELKEGTYDAKIVLESTSPVSFLTDH